MPVLIILRYVVAGLVLVLGGCRSSAIVPKFAPAAGTRSARPAPGYDTTRTVTASDYPSGPQRRVMATGQPRTTDTVDSKPLKRRAQAKPSDERPAEATPGDTTSNANRSGARHPLPQPSLHRLLSTKTLVHYSLHFVFPAVLALVFFPLMWQTAYLIMLATMLMDVDHLLARPIFEPGRCSIGYHPLHSFYAIPVYVLLLLLPATQIIAVGLLFHLFTDTVDCLWSFRHCHECYVNSRIRPLLDWVRKLLGRAEVGQTSQP